MATVEKELAKNTTKQKGPITYDLVLIGASPANLTLAHRLCDLMALKPEMHLSVAILEKSEEFGGHIVSGAVVNKKIFDKAFPNHIEDGMPIESICEESSFALLGRKKKFDVPSAITRALLPDFCKEGYYVLTLSNVVAWMAETLQAKAATVPNLDIDMYNGFPATEIRYENDKISAVKVSNTGVDLEDYVHGDLFCFADKGFLSKDIIKKFELADNPQIWSVGVKETWRLRSDAPYLKGKVWHTLGFPTLDGTLGGGFVYGLDHNRVTIGQVISLDSKNPNIHPQKQLQELKKHPWLQNILRDGELLHYGAAVLPEGGPASLPKAFQVDGALLMGDALGLLDVKALAGVDKAMESGYIGAEVVFESFSKRDFSKEQLSKYQKKLLASPFMDKYKANRYFRQAFIKNPDLLEKYLPIFVDGFDKGGFLWGGLKAFLANPIGLTVQTFSALIHLNAPNEINDEVRYMPGYEHIDPNFTKEMIARNQSDEKYQKTTIYSREDAVFYAQTKYEVHPEHIDEFSAETCLKCIKTYEAKGLDVPCVSDCTAEVHRLDIRDGGVKVHGMSLENCVQCRTCELICPEQNLRVNAAYSAGGPNFKGL
jgi:electron-transferring-flavoprotein dehydrogenase